MLASDVLLAARTSVDGLRVRQSPERTRIVFDLGSPVEHKVFSLTDPHRLVIDISDAELKADVKNLALDQTPIRTIRSSDRNDGKDLRVVLDLAEEVKPRSFVLKPIMQYGDRLVIDLYGQGRLKLDELISGRWQLDQINEAIADTRTGGARRNVILF